MRKETLTIEDVQNEIAELEADQHQNFFKDEPKGRKRMSVLLNELNLRSVFPTACCVGYLAGKVSETVGF